MLRIEIPSLVFILVTLGGHRYYSRLSQE